MQNTEPVVTADSRRTLASVDVQNTISSAKMRYAPGFPRSMFLRASDFSNLIVFSSSSFIWIYPLIAVSGCLRVLQESELTDRKRLHRWHEEGARPFPIFGPRICRESPEAGQEFPGCRGGRRGASAVLQRSSGHHVVVDAHGCGGRHDAAVWRPHPSLWSTAEEACAKLHVPLDIGQWQTHPGRCHLSRSM